MESKYIVTCADGVARVDLVGRLDSNNAQGLADELLKLVEQRPKHVVFFATELVYISSAGLRVIIFAKQKIGIDTTVSLVGAKPEVIDILKMTGFDKFLLLQDDYDWRQPG